MRFYRIVISDPKTGAVWLANANNQPGFSTLPASATLSTYTSLNANMSQYDLGGTNPAAQKIELDIALTTQDASLPNSFVRVWGIGLAEIAQSANLNGLNIEVFGGMAKGLPLANPAQSGLITSGQIIQALGNWAGVDQTLDLFIGQKGSSPNSSATTATPGAALAPASNDASAALIFQWHAGEPLLSAVVSMLASAYPTYSITGAVNPGLVWSGATATGYYSSLAQFAQYIRQKSLSMIAGYAPSTAPGAYPGVSITITGNTITIADGTTQTKPKQLQFMDFVGQPTYAQKNVVQVCCVMRSDIHIGDYVTMPDVLGIVTAGGNSQYFNPQPNSNGYASQKSGSVFAGTFLVTKVRHVGSSRDPAHTAWVTVLDLITASTPVQTVTVLPTIWSTTVGPNTYGFTV